MEILYLIGSMGGGGAEKVMSTMINFFHETYDQKLLTYSPDTVYTVKSEHEIIDYKSSPNKLKNLAGFINNLKIIKQNKESRKVCVSFLEVPNIMNVMTKARDCKSVISVRSLTSENIKHLRGIRYAVLKSLLRITYPRADKVVAVSKEVKEDLVNNFGVPARKIEVINNPINFEKINALKLLPIEHHENEIFSKKTVLHCGRFTEAKGHWYLIKAFKKVIESGQDVNLVLLGDGELKEKAEKLADELGLEDFVYILGYKKNPYQYLYRGDVFIYTSLWEGFPNAVLDAMACGNAIISSDCRSGIMEILDPDECSINSEAYQNVQYGVLGPRFERKMDFSSEIGSREIELAKRLSEILSNTEEMNQLKAIAENRANDFSIEVIMKQWQSVIEGVV